MKNNVIIGIEDDYTSIYVWTSFNNQVIPLFFTSLNNHGAIVNGSVYNKADFSEIINKLINQASKFVGENISEVSLCVHNFNVNIHNFELSIDLKNQVLNKDIWEKDYLPNISIKRIDNDQYIYNIDVVRWEIDNKKYDKLDSTNIHGEKMMVYGKKYIINKLIYDNLIDIFNTNKIKVKSFSTTLDLYKSDTNKNEINVLVGKNNLSITSISNQHLMSNVVSNDIGIELLVKMIHDRLGLEYNIIYEYFKNINFFKNNAEIAIVDVCDYETGKVVKVNQSNMDEIINDYAANILELITGKLEYYKKEKSTNVDNINLISNIPIIQQIFNLFHIHSKYQFNIVKPSSTAMYETRYMYCVLAANKNLKQTRLIN